MRLLELEPQFVKLTSTGGWQDVETLVEAEGIWFLCPLCFQKNGGSTGTHGVLCWFRGVGPEVAPGPGRWAPYGSGLLDLSLTPSVWLNGGGCGWHGWVQNGNITFA